MERQAIELGSEYAAREPPSPGTEMQHVRVLEQARRGRWKVEWIDPNPGLVDYLRSANIICPWSARKTFLRSERQRSTIRSASASMWPGDDHPLSTAVDEVLDATGEALTVDKGVLTAEADAIDRVCTRAGAALDDLPETTVAYVDAEDRRHLTFAAALHLARAFAAAEPSTVLLHIDTVERRYVVEASEVANGYLVPLVERWRAGWALARQWAGSDAQLARAEAETERLRRIVTRTMWDLRTAGQDDLAGKIERQLRGG